MAALRWLFYALVIAGFGGVLAAMRDPVHLAFGRWDISLPFGLLAFFLFIFAVFFISLDRLLLQGDAFARWRQERRLRKARALMIGGFGHLAAHNVDAADGIAQQVSKLSRGSSSRDPFRLVFEGRLSEAKGDLGKANDSYAQLGRQKDARLYALRAQLRIAQKRGDEKLLRDLSGRALKLSPDDLSVHGMHVRALADMRKWMQAHHELQKLAQKNLMAPDSVGHKRAALYLEQSDLALQEGRTGDAITAARKAYNMEPSPMAARMEIDSMLSQARPKMALARLHKAWAAHPDDSLLPFWKSLAPEQNRFKHYEKMLQLAPSHPLTQSALVQAAIDENMPFEARAHLDALSRIDQESYEYAHAKALVAEHLDNNKTEARQWKSRADALRAARHPVHSVSSVLSPVYLPDALS